MVVALPGLDTALAGPGHPLPLLAAAGNPVLAAMWAGSDDPLDVLSDGLRGDVRLVKAADENWIVLSRDIVGFGDQPWVVGTYLPESIAGAEISRLRLALLLSVACLLLAMAATFWLGRRMARPVVKLAEAAQHIQALDLEHVPALPRSRILELDQAARAFNAMGNGLRWFEAYVPRRLVRQLMTNPSPDVVASRELEVDRPVHRYRRLLDPGRAAGRRRRGRSAQPAFRAVGRMRGRDGRHGRQVPGRWNDGVLGSARCPSPTMPNAPYGRLC